MEREEILKRVKNVIANVLKINEEEIQPESNFVFDLGADSQQSLELVAAFEEEFDIDMEEDAALEVQDVNGAVDFLSNYVKS